MKLRKSLTLLWAYNIRLLWLPIMLVAVSISSCDDNNSTPAPLGNIVEIAGKTSDLSTLYAAISKYPSLVNTLSAPGTFTVFAPTNAAFTAVLAAI
ncbi:MAG: fasciclin domain-containing protein, partial [Cyclobacteriaceae bacterium]|nr:fasciclin domain-containing protein [Cyclobacteriaceae bacterium]